MSETPPWLPAVAPCCGVRDMATHTLSTTGIECNEVFVGGGHATVMAAYREHRSTRLAGAAQS